MKIKGEKQSCKHISISVSTWVRQLFQNRFNKIRPKIVPIFTYSLALLQKFCIYIFLHKTPQNNVDKWLWQKMSCNPFISCANLQPTTSSETDNNMSKTNQFDLPSSHQSLEFTEWSRREKNFSSSIMTQVNTVWSK